MFKFSKKTAPVCRIVISLAAVILCVCMSASAQSSSKNKRAQKKIKSKQISCPPIIGDRSDATQTKVSSNPARSRFVCYRNTKDAKKEGFRTAKIAASENFTGWYRMRLKISKDTCSPQLFSGPVLFMQVRHDPAGVFGEFCPTIGAFSGVSKPNGFEMSATEDANIIFNGGFCGGKNIRSHQHLEFSRVVQDGAAFSVKLTKVYRCAGQDGGTESCMREFNGVAFAETDPIWPPVSDTISQVQNVCNTAMTTACVHCHAELRTPVF